jgi:hypothetical protein
MSTLAFFGFSAIVLARKCEIMKTYVSQCEIADFHKNI